MNDTSRKITLRAFLLGALFTAVFAILTSYFGNRHAIYITAVQIPVLPYVLLLLTVLLINPVCRLIRFIRPFTVTETLVVFTMGLVSAGVSTFGLTDQLVPVVGSLFNRHWNNDQTEWNRYVEPFLNDSYFVAMPGIQDAAADYRDARIETETAQSRFDAAARLSQANANRARLQRRLEELEGAQNRQTVQVEISTLRTELANAAEAARIAGAEWANTVTPDLPADPEQAAAVLLDRLQEKRGVVETRRAALAVLETQAFDKVDLFRRGLPAHLRAFPGFVPVSGEDDFAGYATRLRRLFAGRTALSGVRQAMEIVRPELASDTLPADRARAANAELERAWNALKPVSDDTAFLTRRDTVAQQEKEVSETTAESEIELARLSLEKRAAIGAEIKRMESRIETVQNQINSLKKQAKSLADDREMISRHIDVTRNVAAMMTAIATVRDTLPGQAPEATFQALKEVRALFPSIDATFTRYLLGDVPWSDWIGPLWRWFALVLLAYAMLLAFNVLIFRQWAYNEKLIYPLAELPEILVGFNDAKSGWVPEIFKTGLFWIGFVISGLVLGWNILCQTGAVPGLTAMNLTNNWNEYIVNTPLQGLLPTAKSAIFFTMIGLTFLIPAKVSFSLWFFSVLYMVQLLVLVGLAYGVNERSFPEEWWYTFNFRTAEGAGALMVFSSVVLWKCRRYLLCAFRPAVTEGLEADERAELRISSVVFLSAFAGLALILWLGMGANLWHTLFALFVILVITIGLVRAVTEGGLLGFQAWTSPFHFIRAFLGMNRAATAPSLFAPLMVFYSVLFLDIKAFIAPAMANSLKVRDDLRLSRARFHGLMAFSIVLAVVISLAVGIMLAYSKGADNMSGWFYTSFPKSLFDKIAGMTKTPPLPTSTEAGWVIFGAVAMGALLFLRQSLFWLPHPIGMIMLVNPIMRYYWFSIMIGWLAKTLVTRYGGKNTYARVRGLFIGLIAGELIMVSLAMILSLTLDTPIRMDLNRN